MSVLPWDIVEEILCHVPATSLKRLRSTCKRWNRLFNYTTFARKHFDKAVRQSLILMLTVECRFLLMNVNLHGVSARDVTGELSVINSHSNLISEVVHYDGLLVCNIGCGIGLVVWNPCTSQTKWIQPKNPYNRGYYTTYALGSYEDKKSGNNNSYKILRCDSDYIDKPEFAIYEIKSNSWRSLDVTLDCYLVYYNSVSLKRKTYWFAEDRKEKHLGTFLVSFDYTTEIFERLRLPRHRGTVALSVVREEKLSLLLHDGYTYLCIGFFVLSEAIFFTL